MRQPLTLRLTVQDPVPGVVLRVQRGRDALIAPVTEHPTAVTFEVEVQAEVRPDGQVVCHGPVVQGPPAARFLYVNAGTYAGDHAGAGTAAGTASGSPAYNRRAKVPLAGLGAAVVRAAQAQPGTVVAGAISGRARDGGPAAASVPLLGDGWQLARA